LSPQKSRLHIGGKFNPVTEWGAFTVHVTNVRKQQKALGRPVQE
jgi:hypothetical protein